MTWLIVPIALYVIYCGAVFIFQDVLIFPASLAGQPGDAMPTPLTERIELATDQGTTVAWLVPVPGNRAEKSSPLVVFFHGNAELIDQQQAIIDLYHSLDVSVLLVEYRGYGHSEGTPSEKHIVADAVAIVERVLERDSVKADALVLHGRSIGGGFAAQVALRTEPSALVVESTFKSISGMTWRFGVPPFLAKSPLRSDKAFEQLDLPILIMHGKHDEIVSVDHAKQLDQIAKQSTLVLFDATHNTLPEPADAQAYADAVRGHLVDAGVID